MLVLLDTTILTNFARVGLTQVMDCRENRFVQLQMHYLKIKSVEYLKHAGSRKSYKLELPFRVCRLQNKEFTA